MVTICKNCGKHAYCSDTFAITVALRCSRSRGVALRVYRCPHRRGWHLTSQSTWITSPGKPPTAEGCGYRGRMAAVLADQITVDEAVLVNVAAIDSNPQCSLSAARAAVDTWFRWGLVYANGPTVTAVDVDALREIAEQGWNRWLSSRLAGPTILRIGPRHGRTSVA